MSQASANSANRSGKGKKGKTRSREAVPTGRKKSAFSPAQGIRTESTRSRTTGSRRHSNADRNARSSRRHRTTDRNAADSRIIDGTALGISLAMLAAAAAGAAYTGTGGTLLPDFLRILLTPSPAVTDYFSLGSLPACFLNAGLCGLAMALFMLLLPGPSHGNTLAGYFLVIAHCFFGLHFLNLWPCFFTPFLYMALHGLDLKENLHVNMFATCFGPFVSELLFRYTLGAHYIEGQVRLTAGGIALTVLFALLVGFLAPATLPSVKAWHKGYNLYNAGIAYGTLGFFFYSFLYRSTGAPAPVVAARDNAVYDSFGRSYMLFGILFFLALSAACLLAGWLLNGRSFRGIRHLFRDTGYESSFVKKYGMPLCLINIGLYGPLVLLYLSLAVLLTEGAGFTAPTFGVVFAALTFTAMGQHPRNVWPIFAGYPLLYLVSLGLSRLIGADIPWTISTQGYLMSAAFATGLCPIVGRYGTFAGIAAGMLCAAICSFTGSLHGGLMLYNSGFTAGLTALFLIPILEHYVKGPRTHMNQRVTIDPRDLITVEETAPQPASATGPRARRLPSAKVPSAKRPSAKLPQAKAPSARTRRRKTLR